MDCIRIKNLKIKARHGVYEFEKKKDGTFELDIELYLSLEKSGQSDKLEHTIDYDNIVSIVINAFTEKIFDFICIISSSSRSINKLGTLYLKKCSIFP